MKHVVSFRGYVASITGRHVALDVGFELKRLGNRPQDSLRPDIKYVKNTQTPIDLRK